MIKIVLTVLFLNALMSACGGEDSSDIATMFDQGQQLREEAVAQYCACAADQQSDLCSAYPDTCFSSLQQCRDRVPIPTEEQRQCCLEAYREDALQSRQHLQCVVQLYASLLECLKQVGACGADAINTCNGKMAQPNCPRLPFKVYQPLNACMSDVLGAF